MDSQITPEKLKESYAKLPTSELLEIIDNKFDYTDLAVSIALAELSTRKVTETEIAEYKTEQLSKVVSHIRANIIDDLTILQKNLFFFLWFPLITFPFRQNFQDDRAMLKLRQANYYSLLGFISFLLIGIISVPYDLSTITTLAFWVLCFIPAYLFDEYFNRKSQIELLRKQFGHDQIEKGDSNEKMNLNS